MLKEGKKGMLKEGRDSVKEYTPAVVEICIKMQGYTSLDSWTNSELT